MPFLIALLGGAVSSVVIRALLVRAVVALGIGAVTYTGVMIGFNALVSQVQSNMAASAGSTLTFLTLCKVPAAMSVVLSAYTAAMALKGLTALGAITKVGVTGAPGTVFDPFRSV
jgi:NAD/NADP transhydrogenase beta subunit